MKGSYEDDLFDSMLEEELRSMTGSEEEKKVYVEEEIDPLDSLMEEYNIENEVKYGRDSSVSTESSQQEFNFDDEFSSKNSPKEEDILDIGDLGVDFTEEAEEFSDKENEDIEEHIEDVLEAEEDYDDIIDSLSPAMRAMLNWKPPAPKSDQDSLVNEWIQTGWVGFLHIDEILTEAILTGASDVHITADQKVSMTRNGDILRYSSEGYAIPDEETMHMVIHDGILNMQEQAQLNKNFEYEGAYTLMYGPMAGRRTRLTIGRTFGKYFMVFRIISEHIPTIEELKVDQELVDWAKYPNGLFLLCGPTGSGKSTTLASIVRDLQLNTRKKIITIEKPIEYIYPDDAPSLVVQRDVGEDTRGFYEGLTSAMRQSPNVILLGEVRNTEEVTELLRAAETGHLAISTMHTNSVPTTINRIQNLFDGNEQRRIMSTLADTLRGIGNQVLVKTKDGNGRFAVRELLSINNEIKELIVNGDIRGIRKYQIEREATMEHKLANAVKEGMCNYEDALSQTTDPALFNSLLEDYIED